MDTMATERERDTSETVDITARINELELQMNTGGRKPSFDYEMGRRHGFDEAMAAISRNLNAVQENLFGRFQVFAEAWLGVLKESFGEQCAVKQLRIGFNHFMVPTILAVISAESPVEQAEIRRLARRFEDAIEAKHFAFPISVWTLRDVNLDQQSISCDFPMYRTH